jgi:L-amino acid N-acyltransferase YncA
MEEPAMTESPSALMRHPLSRSLLLSGGLSVSLRPMRPDDVDRILAFAQRLSADDLVLLRMDITDRDVVRWWARQLESDRAVSLLAEAQGSLIGYGSLFHSDLTWQRHLGEIRLLVDQPYRSRGLGHALVGELFQIARDRGLRKLVAHVTADQRGAMGMFERHGFRAEALLQDFVIDRHGRTRDLVVMAHDVEGLSNRGD